MAKATVNLIAVPAAPADIVPALAGRELRIGIFGEQPEAIAVETGKSEVPFKAAKGEKIHAELVNVIREGEGSIEQAMLRFTSGETKGNDNGLSVKPAA